LLRIWPYPRNCTGFWIWTHFWLLDNWKK